MIGEGELLADIKRLVEEKDLTDFVLFLGLRNDVPDLLNAMDVFVMTSITEGFPISLIETQANGLPAIVSSSISDEVKFSDSIRFIGLSELVSRILPKVHCILPLSISREQKASSSGRIFISSLSTLPGITALTRSTPTGSSNG